MPRAITRTRGREQHLTLDAAVLAEIEKAKAAGEMEGHPDSRCHVCCEVESKHLVNSLIAAGLTNREITEICASINTRRREKGDRREIQAKSVREHRRNHFNLEKPALAAYREIMERRAEEANLDHINGIGHAITPYALLETVMVKGYAHVTSENTDITTREALDSAVKLHEMTKSDAGTRKMADLLYQMDRIIAAAQEFVPPELHEAFVARVEGRQPSHKGMQKLTETTRQATQEVIREFSPSTKVDEEDEI